MAEAVAMPTVRGIPEDEFNPAADAQFLHAAMKGLGTNDRQLITLLTDRTNAQRLAIAEAYEAEFGQRLVTRIQRETSGKYERVLVALMIPPAHYDAYFLRQAMDGIGTTESLLNEILCTRTGEEIEAIKEAFTEQCGKNLADRVASEIGFGNKHYERFLLRLINNPRFGEEEEVDPDAVAEDAARLAAAGVDKWGTDEEVFIDVFATRSFAHLKQVCITYQSEKGHTLESAVKSELGGNFEDAVLAVLGQAFRPSDFWGEKLKDTMKGLGTSDEALIRMIVARSERDLALIRDNFGTDFGEGKTLETWIAGDTSGKYEDVLLSIVGADQREPIRTEGDEAEVVEEYEPPDEGWQQIPGSLAHIATVRPGEFYGCYSEGVSFYRTLGTEWIQLHDSLKQIDCGGPDLNTVWAVNHENLVFRLAPNRTEWEHIGGTITAVSVGHQGQVWALQFEAVFIYMDGLTAGWENIPGGLTAICCDAITGQVYGIGNDGVMHYRTDISDENIKGSDWQNVDAEMEFTSVVACAGKVVVTTTEGAAFEVVILGGSSAEFKPIDLEGLSGPLRCISIGAAWNLAATTEDQEIFFRNDYAF